MKSAAVAGMENGIPQIGKKVGNRLMGKRILITGGAGFVGSHLADRLLHSGHSVRIVDNLTRQVHDEERPGYLSGDVEFIAGDVRDADCMRRALAGIQVIFHLAAAVGVGQSMYEISRYMSVNAQGTAELLQSILDTRQFPQKLIVASSMTIYGEGRYSCLRCGIESAPALRGLAQLKRAQWDFLCDTCGDVLRPAPTNEEKPSDINSFYALSKRDQEELCLMFGRTYEIPVTALRYFNTYGTRQALSNPYAGVVAIFGSRLINGHAPSMFEDGGQMRDFVHVNDIVRANMLAMERPESDGKVINVGSGNPLSIRRVAELLAQLLGKDIQPEVTQRYRVGDTRHCFADLTRARTLLGYEPQMTHDDGFRELGAWLREQEAKDKTEIMMKELSAHGLTA